MRRDLSAPEVRVLGCLIEKQRTTPDQYPLTLNALRLACNQSTNRDPVTDYDEATVRTAAQSLGRRRLARFTTGHGGRVAKYRHLVSEELKLADDELAVLCVMLLRGPQTPGELKGRTERLHRFGDLGEVEAAVDQLIERELVARTERRPGQKEQRYIHLLSADALDAEPTAEDDPALSPPLAATAAGAPVSASDAGLEARVAALEAAVDRLRRQFDELIGG